MTTSDDRSIGAALHPLHAVLLASALPLFLGALISDIAYSRTYEIQWTNFASWLIAGGLVFAGFASLWAAIDLLRVDRERRHRRLIFLSVLISAWMLGFINALVHAKDAWASMPSGLVLSLALVLLTTTAIWLGYSTSWKADAK